MDDMISRQAAIDAVQSIGRLATLPDNDAVIRMSAVEYVLFNMPSAQPDVARDIATIIENEKDMRAMLQPEIIYCEECKHYNAGFECLIEGYGIERNKDWFCADAERREE